MAIKTPKTVAESSLPPDGKAKFSPLYRQIKSLLLQHLESGTWRPGDAMPSELDLATGFGVSQGTVRRAMDELSKANLVVRRQGKGTFVATHEETHAQFRFLRLRADDGTAMQSEMRLVEFRRIRATADVARALELKAGEAILFMKRILLIAGKPTVLEDISLPGAQFRGLSQDRVAARKGSLYNLFEVEFGVRMIRAEERLKAVAAGSDAGRLLGVPEGTPLLCVDRRSYGYGDRPVEFRRGLYRTTSCFYANSLS